MSVVAVALTCGSSVLTSLPLDEDAEIFCDEHGRYSHALVTQSELDRAVAAGLTPRERQLLQMRVSGMTVEQISSRTGLQRASISVAVSRARGKLGLTRPLS